MRQFKFVLIVSIILFLSANALAIEHCDLLLEKLHHVQSLQRSGYSVKEGIRLRKREDAARDRWWQCEKSSRKKESKKITKHKNSHLRKTLANDSKVKNRGKNAASSFKSNHAIVIKSKYQGAKQQAWLNYYQQPKDCIKPKNLPAFATCIENKQVQRENFEKHYKDQ